MRFYVKVHKATALPQNDLQVMKTQKTLLQTCASQENAQNKVRKPGLATILDFGIISHSMKHMFHSVMLLIRFFVFVSYVKDS